MAVTQPVPPPEQTRDAWLAGLDPEAFSDDRHSVAVDLVLLAATGDNLVLPLIRRREWPSYGEWVLPGGFVRRRQRIAEAAQLVLANKLTLPKRSDLEPLQFFDDPDRDPRTRVISMAYLGRVRPAMLTPQDGIDRLHGVLGPTGLADTDGARIRLAFDHETILENALARARVLARLDYLWPAKMLPGPLFTVPDLAATHRALGLNGNDDVLRRRVVNDARVEQTREFVDRGTGRRPPEGYRLLG